MRNKNRYKKIQVMVAKTSRIDARSCPGGTLIFYEGLLDAAGSEAALVGIVGHELSHLDRGHQLLPIKRIRLMEKTFSSQQDMTKFMQSGPMMTSLFARPFRPEDERVADHDGVAWAYAAGYDPREMAKLFQKKGGKSPVAEGMPWATFFRSHPFDQERNQAILKQYNQLHKDKPAARRTVVCRKRELWRNGFPANKQKTQRSSRPIKPVGSRRCRRCTEQLCACGNGNDGTRSGVMSTELERAERLIEVRRFKEAIPYLLGFRAGSPNDARGTPSWPTVT